MDAARRSVASGDWDERLRALHGHVLQSTGWQRVQEALGYTVLHAAGDGWMWAGAVRSGVFPRYVYAPYGPVTAGSAAPALASIRAAARRERLDFARVEPCGGDPHDTLWRVRAVRVHAVQPQATWILDLGAEEAQLRHGLEAGHRSRINAAERRGLTITSSRDAAAIEWFLDVQRRAATEGGFAGRPDAYHRTVAGVLMPAGMSAVYAARVGDEIVAAAISFDFGDTSYYAHAASTGRGRKLGAMPPLVWRMVLDARAAGRAHFDFWGVVPGAPDGHPWSGFTRFKMGFGGRLVERAGTWEVPVHAVRHRALTLAQRLRRRDPAQ